MYPSPDPGVRQKARTEKEERERGGRDRGMSMKSRDIKKKESNEGKVNKKIWTEE